VTVSNTANQQQSCIQSHDETVQYEYFKPLVFIPLTTPTRGTGIILFLPTYSAIPHGESEKRWTNVVVGKQLHAKTAHYPVLRGYDWKSVWRMSGEEEIAPIIVQKDQWSERCSVVPHSCN